MQSSTELQQKMQDEHGYHNRGNVWQEERTE